MQSHQSQGAFHQPVFLVPGVVAVDSGAPGGSGSGAGGKSGKVAAIKPRKNVATKSKEPKATVAKTKKGADKPPPKSPNKKAESAMLVSPNILFLKIISLYEYLLEN